MAISERDRSVLDFERCWWTLSGTKDAAIRHRLGMSPTRYYALLGTLAASDEALAYDPLVVRRLRRNRDLRRRARYEGRADGRPQIR